MDISSMAENGTLPDRPYVTSEWFTEWGYTISPGRMIRRGDVKYIRYLEGNGEELYFLDEDPHEKVNRASDASVRNTLHEMRALLDKYVTETDDPFFTLEVKADRRWRSHKCGYQNHEGKTAPEM